MDEARIILVVVLKCDLFEHDLDNLNLFVFLQNVRGEHDRRLPALTDLDQRVFAHDDLVMILASDRRCVLVSWRTENSSNPRVPPRLIVLMPNEKPGLQINLLLKSLILVLVGARIVNRELLVDLVIDIARQKKIVILDRMHMISSHFTLIRVELPIDKDELVTRWEQMALSTHAKANLRIVVNQTAPSISRLL